MKEEDWVETLSRRFPFSRGIGIGDDAAVLSPDAVQGKLVITTDLLVEGVHFRLNDISPRQLAQKSLAVNLSDLAAMGAKPLFYTLALALPPHYMAEALHRFYDGLEEGNRRWGVELAGGDFSAGTVLTVSITAFGEAERPILRRGAREGDLVGVCGRLGWSKLGLNQLLGGMKDSPFIHAHVAVEPLLQEGVVLGRYASAMMDVSDGLLKDLRRLCAASGVGAEIDGDRLDMDPSYLSACRECRMEPLETALNGGEDYALLFSIPEEASQEIEKTPGGVPFRVIGRIVPAEKGVRVFSQGRELFLKQDGFDHFQAAQGQPAGENGRIQRGSALTERRGRSIVDS